MGVWPKIMEEILQSVDLVCRGVKGKGLPAYGAIAYIDTVRLCAFDPETHAMAACDDWPGRYFVNLLNGPLLTYLDLVKEEFARGWGLRIRIT